MQQDHDRGHALPVRLAVLAALVAPQGPSPARADEQLGYGARAVVVGVTPALGADVDRDKVPANVQVVSVDERSPHAVSVADTLGDRVASVTLGDVQNNPAQRDLYFRGFSVSPLLGTAQALSVYQNGVRANEPFGEVVQWDLIPDFALAEMQLLPGAHPVFGQNALGGSLVLRMKNGFEAQRLRALASGGSFARGRGILEHGARFGVFASYVGVDYLRDDSFRDASPTRIARAYADVRHRGARHEISLDVTAATTSLQGNGPAPVELLARRRSAIFTSPDITENQLLLVSAHATQELSRQVSLQLGAYARHMARDTVNGDEAELEPCPSGASLCDDEGQLVRTESGGLVPASAIGDAALNRTRTRSNSYGISLQSTIVHGGRSAREVGNHLTMGASVDASEVDFVQRAEVGALAADRSVSGSGYLLGDDAFRTLLATSGLSSGLYASDTWSPTSRLSLTFAGRFDHVVITLDDQLGTSLDAGHAFSRVNPALGVTYRIDDSVTVFANYGEASRAPSAAELSCADPDEPCRVPNAFLSDPPLAQVVTRTVELGARATFAISARRSLGASAAAFGARNYDDILFVAGSRVGTGYFRNAGTTQRAGVELGLDARHDRLDAYARYTLLSATFQTALELPGESHPRARTNQEGARVIDVRPGDELPGVPAHQVKLGAGVRIASPLRIGAQLRVMSGQWLRGDETNTLGRLPGYAVVSVDARYEPFEFLSFFARAENLFDTRYESFGVLGDAEQVLPYADNPRFVSPGAPFGVFVGVEAKL